MMKNLVYNIATYVLSFKIIFLWMEKKVSSKKDGNGL